MYFDVLGSLQRVEACNINVAASDVFFTAETTFVGLRGGLERPAGGPDTYIYCYLLFVLSLSF